MRRFWTWLCKWDDCPGGCCVNDWVTREEAEQIDRGTDKQFWGWYEIARTRKQWDNDKRSLCWMVIVWTPFAALSWVFG